MSGIPALVDGYPKLAGQMGNFPETAILRRFSNLNSQNLLYLQAEIIHLENKLRKLETVNSQAEGGKKLSYAKDWYWLNNSVNEGDGAQWNTMLEIREKLKEYSMPATSAWDLNSMC
jgi:hypothetical protein